jgi:hypothetical protein
LALDMVRLEWAEIEAYDGAAEPALVPGDVLASDPDPRFRLQPYLQLLSLHYAVDDLLVAIRKDDSDSEMASNAVSEGGKRTHLRKVARQKPQAIFLVVHRVDDSIYFKRIEPESFKFLKALREGKSLSIAVTQAFEGQDIQENKLLTTVQGWFENWSSLGWLCTPNSTDQGFISASGRQS